MSRPTAAQREPAAQRAIDERHIRRCLELALAYKGYTRPNPVVGCVIVDKRGTVIAEGAHAKAGTAHAEIVALQKLAGKAPGATLYVNLEPCNHHGRTPPCAPAVADAGVARVVIGHEDPVDGHGGGIELLRRRGIRVTTGVLPDDCVRANRGFYVAAEHQRPAFTLKAAMTLDGKIATVTGQSKWITGEQARADVHRLRHEHDAILVGIETVLRDDPWLNCRLPKRIDPVRVVLDSQLRTPPGAHVLPRKTSPARTIVACSEKAPASREKALVGKGAEVWRTKTHANGRIDVRVLARQLLERAQIQSVLVEGGGEVHAYMMLHELCDDLVLYVGPKAVGGPAKSWLGGKGLATLTAAYRFRYAGVPVLLPGEDLRLHLERVPRAEAPAKTDDELMAELYALDPP